MLHSWIGVGPRLVGFILGERDLILARINNLDRGPNLSIICGRSAIARNARSKGGGIYPARGFSLALVLTCSEGEVTIDDIRPTSGRLMERDEQGYASQSLPLFAIDLAKLLVD